MSEVIRGKVSLRFASGVFAVLGLLLTTLIASGEPSRQVFTACQSSDCHYYLARWIWNVDSPETPYWVAPFVASNVGLLDLRSLPQMNEVGPTPQGYGLFVYSKSVDICPLACSIVGVKLSADKLDTTVPLLIRSAIETRLGLDPGSISGTTVRAILAELLIKYGDPTGQSRWKPIRGSLKDGYQIILAGQEVVKGPLDAPILANTIAVFQDDYRRNKAAGMALETLQKWTGATMQLLFGQLSDELATQLLPSEYVTDGWRSPETTITESFNQADSGTLGPDLTWDEFSGTGWQTVSNVASLRGDVGINHARADSVLSTDDHYAQVTLTAITEFGGNQRAGILCRKDNTATNTHYFFWPSWNEDNFQIWKSVGGSLTQIATGGTTPVINDIARGEVDGDQLTLKRNGTTVVGPSTDTSITGNLYCGISGHSTTAAGNIMDVDLFEAGDLAVAARRIAIVSQVPWWK